MRKDPLKGLRKSEVQSLLNRERKRREVGKWGEWHQEQVNPGYVTPNGWGAKVNLVYNNNVFAVLSRPIVGGARHLAVSSLSQIRPTWWEMQRIKNELCGEHFTAVEVYPPQAEVVDGADMFHIWVLPGDQTLQFSLIHS